ncbi:MAG: DUF3631 domain-containing protein [Dehalococcoidia bacterium]
MALKEGENGVVLFCHAGCDNETVIATLKERGLWTAAPSRNERKASPKLTRYEIRDEAGALQAVHDRRDLLDGSKTFVWARPDGSVGLGGVPARELPLYGSERLPELADGARIVLTEGEKSTQALRPRGIAAVGTVCGAASTPGDDALRPLARLAVTLWPDNDDPGHAHMLRIGDALRRLGCADVRAVSWPGAPDKGDAADFAGADDELAALLDGADTFAATVAAVDLASLLDDVTDLVRRYVVLTDDQGAAIALWVLHTHVLDAFDVTPYLSITSPEKRSGKTRLLEVLKRLVARPWMTARTSAAALYRRVDAETPTLLLDESDTAFRSGDEYSEGIRGVLNSGFERGGSTTVCVGQGKDITYREFSTFGAKAIAGIGKLPDTLADRSVSVRMKRQGPGEKAERLRRRRMDKTAAPLRERITGWAAGALGGLELAEPAMPDFLDDRAADSWESLLAIADLAGADWPSRGRQAALTLSVGDSREDDSLGVRLLADVRRVFDRLHAQRLTSADLISALVEDERAPWGEIKGKPLDARALARMVKRYDVRPKVMRLPDGSTQRGYMVKDFADAWSRYTPQSAQHPQHPQHRPNLYLPDVTDVTLVTLNRGMGAQGTCSLCPCAEIDGYTANGEARCFGHYVRETDGPLIRSAIEEFGLSAVARRNGAGATI